jgi:hypothetical protein
MTFAKTSTAGGRRDCDWNLSRFATKEYLRVPGGFSKLLTYFEREKAPKKLLSYADRRYSEGNVYEKNKFELVGTTVPNYWYFRSENERKHRYNFRKDTLKSLPGYNASKTEYTMMLEEGWERIWDCGNLTYIKSYSVL